MYAISITHPYVSMHVAETIFHCVQTGRDMLPVAVEYGNYEIVEWILNKKLCPVDITDNVSTNSNCIINTSINQVVIKCQMKLGNQTRNRFLRFSERQKLVEQDQ